MRWQILAALLLCACANLDSSERHSSGDGPPGPVAWNAGLAGTAVDRRKGLKMTETEVLILVVSVLNGLIIGLAALWTK